MFNPTGEQVIRHRGERRDEDGKLTSPAADVSFTPVAVAPGGGSEFSERARNGETIAAAVYFDPGTDIKNDDELTVREERFRVIVNDWRHPLGGIEVLCTRSQG
jgi:hypothetical protein